MFHCHLEQGRAGMGYHHSQHLAVVGELVVVVSAS
jgi:hypothetical protein